MVGSPFVLLLLFATEALVSCVTTPTKFDEVNKAKWSAKLLIRDMKDVRSQIVNADIVAFRPDRLRMELSTPIGIYVASFVMNHETVKYALPKDKRFVEGPATAQSMKSAVGVGLDPHLFIDILFDAEPTEKTWVCKRDKKGFLESCENKSEGVSVSWADREMAKKRIEVKTAEFILQVALKGFSTKVEESPSLFELAQPEGYKYQKIETKHVQ